MNGIKLLTSDLTFVRIKAAGTTIEKFATIKNTGNVINRRLIEFRPGKAVDTARRHPESRSRPRLHLQH